MAFDEIPRFVARSLSILIKWWCTKLAALCFSFICSRVVHKGVFSSPMYNQALAIALISEKPLTMLHYYSTSYQCIYVHINRVRALGRIGLQQDTSNLLVFGTFNKMLVQELDTSRLVSKWHSHEHMSGTIAGST